MKKSELMAALKEMPHLVHSLNYPFMAKEYAERYFVYQPTLSGVDIVREYLVVLWKEGYYQFDLEN